MQAEDRRRLLVRGGTVVNADRKLEADVYCEDGIIKCGSGGQGARKGGRGIVVFSFAGRWGRT